MQLDLQAARAMARARLFERAVHDPGPWTVRIGDRQFFAVKIRTPQRVIFIANFDLGADASVAWLSCNGIELSSMDIEPPGDGVGFALEWRLTDPLAEKELAVA